MRDDRVSFGSLLHVLVRLLVFCFERPKVFLELCFALLFIMVLLLKIGHVLFEFGAQFRSFGLDVKGGGGRRDRWWN